MKPVCFVIPWYGEYATGGAESAVRGLCEDMARKGVKVTVLTTCVKNFKSPWDEQFYPEGQSFLNGVCVERFKSDNRNGVLFDGINLKLLNGLRTSLKEENDFLRESINSTGLLDYVGKHFEDYGAFVFAPYLFGLTFYGVQKAGKKAVLMPCFHDEPYIYLRPFKEVFEKVKHYIFLSEPEKELAFKTFDLKDRSFIVSGCGIDKYEDNGESEAYGAAWETGGFKEKYGVDGDYILYAGRKEEGKGIEKLLSYYERFCDDYPKAPKLVLIGGGKVNISPKLKGKVIDAGYVSIEDKRRAFKEALFLVNPSPNESFSIVIMESFMAKRPVVVNSVCEVTKDFAIKSKGGLFYKDYPEFEAVLNKLTEDRALRESMGESGYKFVLDNFTREKVLDKILTYLEAEFK
ncbi:MAG: glycosyltransferase family 4 protein [Lachnospiraceae bacterium]|nr:glycosyltransferase family 4 protein [Lachnospiraceae bacterium]